MPLNVVVEDEARRALVALEMDLSGNYVTPTINGEIYLNKPPLYNWITLAYIRLFGEFSMFNFRLPVVVAIIGLGVTVYIFTKRYLGRSIAFFTAFAFMTNGRILIYDSFIGLIDTTFSWLVYTGFMVVYYFGERKKWFHLFLITYIITAAGFMMKGLPSLVFQGVTLLTYFTWKKDFKKLFHISHFAGIAVFFVIVGGYYLYYFSVNNLDPGILFKNLFNESSKRSVTHHGFWKTIIHFLKFPFENLYHFAPWTIIVIALFQKKIRSLIIENDFIFYSFLVMVVNILVYWFSPGVFPRYLFMFLPLLFSILLYLYFSTTGNSWQRKAVGVTVLTVCALMMIGFIVLPFLDIDIVTPNKYVKSFLLAGLFAALLYTLIRNRSYYLYIFILALIVFRMGFNWFIIEHRKIGVQKTKDLCYRIVDETSGRGLYILKGAKVGNFDAMSFHITQGRGEILRYDDKKNPGVFYIAGKSQLINENYTSYLKFVNRHSRSDSLQLVQFK